MATNQQIETVSTGADKAKLFGSLVLVVGGVVAFYMLGKADLWMRVVALLALMLLGVAMFFLSEPGKRLVAFGRESVKEVRKVVWPSQKEAMQSTGLVFLFVVTMALFLWIVDKILEWGLYDVILGWKH
jgi:preprotein translocase subunit SecE